MGGFTSPLTDSLKMAATDSLGEMMRGLTAPMTDSFSLLMRAFQDAGYTDELAEAVASQASDLVIDTDNFEAIVVSALVVVLLLVMRAKLEAAAAAIAEALVSQALFLITIAAQLEDRYPEVRGVLAILGARDLMLLGSQLSAILHQKSAEG